MLDIGITTSGKFYPNYILILKRETPQRLIKADASGENVP